MHRSTDPILPSWLGKESGMRDYVNITDQATPPTWCSTHGDTAKSAQTHPEQEIDSWCANEQEIDDILLFLSHYTKTTTGYYTIILNQISDFLYHQPALYNLLPTENYLQYSTYNREDISTVAILLRITPFSISHLSALLRFTCSLQMSYNSAFYLMSSLYVYPLRVSDRNMSSNSCSLPHQLSISCSGEDGYV